MLPWNERSSHNSSRAALRAAEPTSYLKAAAQPRAAAHESHNSSRALQSQQLTSCFESCSTAAHELLNSCGHNSSRAPAKLHSSPRQQSRARKRAACPNSFRTPRGPSKCFQVARARFCKRFATPKIVDPTASSPQNQQTLKVPNSTPYLQTRPVAVTEWELTTPSPERARRLRWA